MPPYYRIDGLIGWRRIRGKPILTAEQIEDVVAYLVDIAGRSLIERPHAVVAKPPPSCRRGRSCRRAWPSSRRAVRAGRRATPEAMQAAIRRSWATPR